MGCGSGGLVDPRFEEKPGGRKVFCVKFQKEMPGWTKFPSTAIRSGSASMRTSPKKPGRCGWSR